MRIAFFRQVPFIKRSSFGDLTITYARSRLLLGITGVGSIVVISVYLLASGLPLEWLPTTQSWSGEDLLGLLSVIACLIAVMTPFDLLGGYLLPNRFRPKTIALGAFLKSWSRGVLTQSVLFFCTSLFVLVMGRWLGLTGAILAVVAGGVVYAALQLRIARTVASLPMRVIDPSDRETTIAAALEQTSRWGWKPRPVVVLDHNDTGFTGGIMGLPGLETIVLPSGSLVKLTPAELAITIARRLEAIRSGSRTRGLLLAFAWVTVGFALSSILPGAGVTSVGELAMTSLGFTLWTFLGLLTLPTLSRQASYAIDGQVIEQGADAESLFDTLKTLDRLQDDEPKRSALIETIFHPVPSIENRRSESTSTFPIAWHAARMTLFISWASMGMLVRAVHCNVGRPELWVMLPTD